MELKGPADSAIDKCDNPVVFLLSARRDLDAAKRFFRKMPADQPLLSPDRIGSDAASPYPSAIASARNEGILARMPLRDETSAAGESGAIHFRVKRNMPRVGRFRSFETARGAIQGFEAML